MKVVLPVEVIEFGPLNDVQRAELEGDEIDPFDAVGITLTFRPKDRHVGLRGPDMRLVASAGLLLADVQIADRPREQVVGIGGVIVSAPHRGQGLASRLIAEVLSRAATMGPSLVMLFCHRDRAGLYTRHSFAEVDPPVLVQQPGGYAEVPQVTMWRALRDGASLPPGRLTVHSLPF